MDAKVGKKSSPLFRCGGPSLMAAIRIVALGVFLGVLLIWIVMCTNTYRKTWLPKLRADTNSTYFGKQGAMLLIFCFPILFIAALGCIYLHIANKNKNKEHLSLWDKPVLVKGPLGIVSGTELVLFIMFLALLVWSLSTYLHNSFVKITPKSAAVDGEKVWEEKLEISGLWLGLVGNIVLAFLFFPVARGSSVLPLLGVTSEGSIKYHIWLGHITMALFTAHGVCYIIYWGATNQMSETVRWDKIGVSNLAGVISLLAGLILWITTLSRIRRKLFELFFYTHYLYILFVVFFVFHVGISFSCMMLPGFYLFLIDRYLRFLQSRRRVRLISARLLPCDTLELNFAKTNGLSYNPASVLFMSVPSISKLQWHPFTITSNSNLEPERLSVVIKCEGSWTHKLYQMLSTSSIDHLNVSVEGPYGPVSTNFLRHDTLVMVSGGSGITPFISIIRELIFQSTTLRCPSIPNVVLICAFKSSSSLTMLDLILPISGTLSDISKLKIQIEAYVTREKEPKSDLSCPRVKWFKPLSSDAPVSPILGPNAWLWLAAIISSSFIIFLILIGIINRYYIYPIDRNTNKIFSYSLRSLLQMLATCFGIVVTATAAVLWNKKHVEKEARKISNMEGLTPTTSPNTVVDKVDRELESLPFQSLVQSTNVQYGVRPDLKKLLLGCKGSSVGVLAAGPKRLRHDVAAICSSGIVENVHFESISFTW